MFCFKIKNNKQKIKLSNTNAIARKILNRFCFHEVNTGLNLSHAVFRFSLLKAKMNPKFRQNTHQSADILQKQHGKKKAKVRHSAVSAGPRNKSAGPKNTEMLTFGVV